MVYGYIYSIVNLIALFLFLKKSKKKINPITIYIGTFSFSSLLYSLNLIYYNDISFITFLTLIIFEFIFCFSCYIGMNSGERQDSEKEERYLIHENENKRIRNKILFLSLIASISVLSGFFLMLKAYGFDILKAVSAINKIYNERLSGENDFIKIPYLSSFAYVAVIYSGIYIKKYGFKFFTMLPIVLICLHMLVSGNRYYLIIAIVEFISAFFMSSRANIVKNNSFKKTFFGLIIALTLLIWIFIVISKVRSSWIDTNEYSSPLMNKLTGIFGSSVYKVYTYAASPIPVLDSFLKDPYSSNGIFTFYPFYNLFRKIGLINAPTFIGKTYYVPVDANTGTYILALIADFSVFSLLFVALFGFACGTVYKKALSGSLFYVSLNAIFASILSLCFFSWYFSDSGLWLCVLILVVLEMIERGTVHLSNNSFRRSVAN